MFTRPRGSLEQSCQRFELASAPRCEPVEITYITPVACCTTNKAFRIPSNESFASFCQFQSDLTRTVFEGFLTFLRGDMAVYAPQRRAALWTALPKCLREELSDLHFGRVDGIHIVDTVVGPEARRNSFEHRYQKLLGATHCTPITLTELACPRRPQFQHVMLIGQSLDSCASLAPHVQH